MRVADGDRLSAINQLPNEKELLTAHGRHRSNHLQRKTHVHGLPNVLGKKRTNMGIHRTLSAAHEQMHA